VRSVQLQVPTTTSPTSAPDASGYFFGQPVPLPDMLQAPEPELHAPLPDMLQAPEPVLHAPLPGMLQAPVLAQGALAVFGHPAVRLTPAAFGARPPALALPSVPSANPRTTAAMMSAATLRVLMRDVSFSATCIGNAT
jgi:hypothetical protein